MDEDIETLVVRVRADTQGLARDVEAMRGAMEGPLADGADRAGRRIEQGLLRAVRTGQLGFEDLRRIALSAMDQIAGSALRSGIEGLGGGGSGGLLSLGTSLLTAALGLPGRATGGPVAPGRAYRVGERGPEIFVPTTSGQVVAHGAGGGAREVRVNIAINGAGNGRGGESEPQLLARSARQVARAVRGAIG